MLACRFHASLTLLHVLSPINVAWEVAGGGGGNLVQEVLAHQEDLIEKKLEWFLADELGHFEVRCVFAEGDPAFAIVGYARLNGIDLSA